MRDEILDLHTDPVLASSTTANTGCDPLDPDGLLQVTADMGAPLPGAYIFEWFTGSDTSTPFNNTPVSLGGDGIIASLAANIEEIQNVLNGQYTKMTELTAQEFKRVFVFIQRYKTKDDSITSLMPQSA